MLQEFLGVVNVISSPSRYLLENGGDPNIQDKSGKTALMHACLEQAGAEILSLLLSSGADPTLEDHTGLSALVYAVNSGNSDILRVLLDACKAKGKEVIIITTNKLPSGHQMTKQYLNVPPPPDLEERMHYTQSSCMWPYEFQLRTPPQGSSASASPQPGSPLLGLREPQCFHTGSGLITSRPSSPIQHPSPLRIPGVDKRLNLQRLHSEPWSKSPSLLLQQSQASSLTEEPAEITPEEELSFRVNDLPFHGRPPVVSRHHSIDVKDSSGLLRALEMSGNETRGGGGRRVFGRKMSYDSAACSPHSASHPNLLQDTLQNVVRQRNIGINHYSSDSQLPQFGSKNNTFKNVSGSTVEPEGNKPASSGSSTLSGSGESLESLVPRRGATALERRGSGALLLDHIAHTRPGYLPPLNPHAPIPDIGVSSSTSYPLSGSSKTLNSLLTGSKPFLPCAPSFPRDLKSKKMLWRRHSMQSEQIKQLANFREAFGH